ncbi:MAG: protein kinase [Kofleriaceae bacterium]
MDPLAHTATATPERGASPEAAALPDSIARFRIERQLGAGAMGVVYAAFDPDLERRVAVKVLHAAPRQTARNRLLREARAMARLYHPNVVTVHEVGTSGDRDYVATELIIGSNLSEWLRAAPRSKREIVDAFLAAGRGLVAAHEAGLVHRDFKPHNVLRSNEGRIVVTDFGLARASHVDEEQPDSLPILDDATSLESEITRTGALVGTPGYMAPEQWAGTEVDAAADQFSFCVALWEALAGQRPFLGATIEELRAQVQHPPTVTGVAERIPRALRHILLRGLAKRPQERYPTMRALIESIEEARRRPRRVAAIAVGVGLVVLAVIFSRFAATPREDTACPSPLMRAEEVWSPTKRAAMPDRIAQQLDRKVAQWKEARELACKSETAELRRVRAACLDAVISTIDLAIKAMSSVDEATRRASDVTDLAAWSQACMEPTVPVLHPVSAAQTLPSAALLLRTQVRQPISDAELDAAIGTAQGRCDLATALYVRAVVHVSKTSFGREAAAAEEAVDACGDDYLRARLAVLRAHRTETPFYGPEQMTLLRKANAAVERVADTALLAQLDLIRGRAAYTNTAFDTAISNFQRARKLAEAGDDSRAAFEARWLEIVSRAERGRAADLDPIVDISRELYGEMVKAYGATSANLTIPRSWLAMMEWRAGNLERSRQALAEALADPTRSNLDATRPIRGKVVDEGGRPIANALVLALATSKAANVDDVDLALWERDGLRDVARAVTASDGTFAMDVAASDVFVLARGGGKAAPVTLLPKAAGELTLRAGRPGTVQGTIDVGARSRFTIHASIGAGRRGFHFVAPVAADGRYVVSNIPPGWYEMRALIDNVGESSLSGRRIYVGPGLRNDPVDFGDSQGDSTIYVIVRNERAGALNVAQTFVLRGKVQATTLGELRPFLDASPSTNLAMARPTVGERGPNDPRPLLSHGDLFVAFEHLEAGVQSVCSIGLSGDFGAEDFIEKLQDSASKLDVRCKTVTLKKGAKLVVEIAVPPMVRVD